MGSCLSKPTSVDGQLFQKTDGHQAAARDLAGPFAEQEQQHLWMALLLTSFCCADGVPATIGPATGSREHDTLKVSAEVGRWSPENVATWAASLGLAQTSMQALKVGCNVQDSPAVARRSCDQPPEAAEQWCSIAEVAFVSRSCICTILQHCVPQALIPRMQQLPRSRLHFILQGVTGSELLKVTDQRLLQLGVKDAAERHALLAACSSLQQQGASANRPAQLSKLADSAAAQLHGTAQSPTSSLAGPASRAALPAHLDSTGGGTALPKYVALSFIRRYPSFMQSYLQAHTPTHDHQLTRSDIRVPGCVCCHVRIINHLQDACLGGSSRMQQVVRHCGVLRVGH